MLKPLARTEGLIIAARGENLVISDPASGLEHELAPLTAALWRAADGSRTVTELCALMASGLGAGESDVWTALDLLADAGLLQARVAPPASTPDLSRRRLLRTWGAAAAAFAVAPALLPSQAHGQPSSEQNQKSSEQNAKKAAEQKSKESKSKSDAAKEADAKADAKAAEAKAKKSEAAKEADAKADAAAEQKQKQEKSAEQQRKRDKAAEEKAKQTAQEARAKKSQEEKSKEASAKEQAAKKKH